MNHPTLEIVRAREAYAGWADLREFFPKGRR